MREAPEKYKKLQKEWKTYELIWSFIHYGLGLAASALAFLASSAELRKLVRMEDMAGLAIASGLVATILTFLSPAARRKAYTEACNILRINRMRFELEEGISEEKLINAVEKGQEIISKR